MTRALFTVFLGMFATHANALTPLPPACSYDGITTVEGRDVIDSRNSEGGIAYYATLDAAGRLRTYLEQCKSGKILRAISGPDSTPLASSRSSESLRTQILNALSPDTTITFSKLRRNLRDMKIATKRYTSNIESCACNAYFPELRGTKTPYERDAQ